MPDYVYDAVRYSNNPYAQTHPERLATVAILHGLTPPGPFHSPRAGDRLRGGRQPDGDGGGDAGHPRAGRRPGGGADRGGPGARSPRSAWATSSCARATARPRRRLAGRVRLHRRPRRLQLDPGRRARRADGHDPREPRARPASPTSPSTPIPAATSGGCCATSGSGTRARSTPATRPSVRPRRRSSTSSSPSTA